MKWYHWAIIGGVVLIGGLFGYKVIKEAKEDQDYVNTLKNLLEQGKIGPGSTQAEVDELAKKEMVNCKKTENENQEELDLDNLDVNDLRIDKDEGSSSQENEDEKTQVKLVRKKK